jgi:hypothetical protein
LVVMPFIMSPRERRLGGKGGCRPRGYRFLVNRVEVSVVQPRWGVVLLREARDAGVHAGQADNREVIFGFGHPCGQWSLAAFMTWVSIHLLVWWQ